MHAAQWSPSTSITIDDSWPPGSYLLKLNSSEGGAHYIPLTVRRDDCAASLVVVSAVTTWQAYNPWGGRSLYENFGPGVALIDRRWSHLIGHARRRITGAQQIS